MDEVDARIVRGSFWLSTGQIFSTAIAFSGGIIIARLLGPEQYGIVGVALIFPRILLGVLDLGLNYALVRYVHIDHENRYIPTAFTYKLIEAIIAAAILFLLADNLAYILARPYITPYLRILTVYVFGLIILESVKAVLTGHGEYHKIVIIESVRSFFRITTALTLIILGLGVYGAVSAFSIGALITLILVPKLVVGKNLRVKFDIEAFKELLLYSIPIHLPFLLEIPLRNIVQIILVNYTTNTQLGWYTVAINLIIPLNIIGFSLATSMFSALPMLLNNRTKMNRVIVKATLYTSIITLPLAFGLIAFSRPIVYLVYGEKYLPASIYLSILATHGLLAPLGLYIIGPYFNSVGATKNSFKMGIVRLSFYLPLGIPAIIYAGVTGLLIVQVISDLLSTLYGLRLLKREFGVNIVYQRNIVILASLAVPALMAGALIYLLSVKMIIKTIIALIIYLVSVLIIIGNQLKIEEIRELKMLSYNIKVIGTVIVTIFDVMEKLNRETRRLLGSGDDGENPSSTLVR